MLWAISDRRWPASPPLCSPLATLRRWARTPVGLPMSSPRRLRGIMLQRRRGPQANSAAAGRTARHAPLAGLLTRGIHLSSVRTPSGCACGAECTGFLHLLLLEPRNLVKFTAVSSVESQRRRKNRLDSPHAIPTASLSFLVLDLFPSYKILSLDPETARISQTCQGRWRAR